MTERLERRFVVLDWQGLHARTATRFARTAAGFGAHIEVERDGTSGDGKNVMEVLLLVAAASDELIVRAHGPDAPAALAALSELITRELSAAEPRARARGGTNPRRPGRPPPAAGQSHCL